MHGHCGLGFAFSLIYDMKGSQITNLQCAIIYCVRGLTWNPPPFTPSILKDPFHASSCRQQLSQHCRLFFWFKEKIQTRSCCSQMLQGPIQNAFVLFLGKFQFAFSAISPQEVTCDLKAKCKLSVSTAPLCIFSFHVAWSVVWIPSLSKAFCQKMPLKPNNLSLLTLFANCSSVCPILRTACVLCCVSRQTAPYVRNSPNDVLDNLEILDYIPVSPRQTSSNSNSMLAPTNNNDRSQGFVHFAPVFDMHPLQQGRIQKEWKTSMHQHTDDTQTVRNVITSPLLMFCVTVHPTHSL